MFRLAHAADALQLIENIKSVIINPLITLLFSIALVVFLYGVYEMIAGGASDEARKTGHKHILWGVIGMFIMVATFGIMNLICQTFNLNCS